MFNNLFFFFFENLTIYEIKWKNVELARPQITIWCTRIVCCIPKAINTHLAYVILIAFTLQQWLDERTSMLLYTYMACIANFHVILLPPPPRPHTHVSEIHMHELKKDGNWILKEICTSTCKGDLIRKQKVAASSSVFEIPCEVQNRGSTQAY